MGEAAAADRAGILECRVRFLIADLRLAKSLEEVAALLDAWEREMSE